MSLEGLLSQVDYWIEGISIGMFLSGLLALVFTRMKYPDFDGYTILLLLLVVAGVGGFAFEALANLAGWGMFFPPIEGFGFALGAAFAFALAIWTNYEWKIWAHDLGNGKMISWTQRPDKPGETAPTRVEITYIPVGPRPLGKLFERLYGLPARRWTDELRRRHAHGQGA